MASAEDDGMELETLQAQIDMSMAFTHNLISGWMKTSKAKLPSSSRASGEKEIEEYMRRPPRLGVGASVPESTGVLSRETAKLRNKLIGSNKKRAREDDEPSGPTPASKTIVLSDDEEDSRARVITKKARADPFAAKTKEKNKGKADPLQALASAPGSMLPLKKIRADAEKAAISDTPAGIVHTELASEASAAPLRPTKRKKKKKHKVQSSEAVSPEGSHPGAATPRDTAVAASKPEVIVITDTPPPTAPHPLPEPVAGMTAKTSPPPKAAPSGDSVTLVNAATTPTRARAEANAPQSSPQRLDPFGMPLLNLSGPPPGGQATLSDSPKKRRKKKKKKKKKGGEISAKTQVINVDDDDDEDD